MTRLIPLSALDAHFPRGGYSHHRMLGLSALHLLNAGILANDPAACAEEARRIYSRRSGGMWKKIQADARKTLRLAELHGATLERPYWFQETGTQFGPNYKCLMVLDGGGDAWPIKSVPYERT